MEIVYDNDIKKLCGQTLLEKIIFYFNGSGSKIKKAFNMMCYF